VNWDLEFELAGNKAISEALISKTVSDLEKSNISYAKDSVNKKRKYQQKNDGDEWEHTSLCQYQMIVECIDIG
jgi:hypothetical protein